MAEVPTFRELLAECRHSALHLEMRDGYMRSDPSFIAWQKGEYGPEQAADVSKRPWLRLMQETTGRGVEVRRARIVSEPISDYVRFEYDVTVGNIVGGEQVRWLPRRRATDLALPGNDFWLFDGRTLLINHFAGDGEVAPEDSKELITDPAVVKLCATAFAAVWDRAIPHEEYQPG